MVDGVPDDIGDDRCMRAAQAAIEVVREECSDMNVEVREVADGLLLEVPEEAAAMMDNAGESPVPLDNFTDVVDQSNFIRNWLAGRSASGGITVDPDSKSYAAAVHSLAATIFEDGVAFEPRDLVGSEALTMIADAT